MAKDKVSDWSSSPANNTDIGGIDINEGCAPSGINNAIRELMAQIKDMITGADGDSQTVGGNLTVNGTTTLVGDSTAPTQLSTDNSTKIATTAFVKSITSLLGSMSTQNSNSVNITGGSITGITDLAPADGGTGLSSITANAVMIGNGTSPVTTVSPSSAGNVLTSDGTSWSSQTPNAIGVGQTYQDMSGSRSLGTSYTNNTGKPIFVYVTLRGKGNSVYTITVGSLTWVANSYSEDFESQVPQSFIVPNGMSYAITHTSGTGNSFGTWVELR